MLAKLTGYVHVTADEEEIEYWNMQRNRRLKINISISS